MKKSAAGNGKAKPASKPRKPAASSHQLAQRFPEGVILTDLTKSEWKLGRPIGSGGFGLLYLADSNSSSTVSDNAKYVVKVEPHSNGPLFCELHFYQRAAKPDFIRDWMTSHRMKFIGVPKFIATGNTEFEGVKYRFLVMERFGTDLQKLFEKSQKRFPTRTVFLLGLKLLDILEYIHSKEYVHADIKASNLLTGFTDQHQVYLVDYGLAFRYLVDGKHKEYREDPKRSHDGTIEFTSCDAHRGVAPSRRGDLEILGYCMVQWLCGRLPWEDKLSDKNYVKNEKIKYMADIRMFMNKCFPSATNIPMKELSAYLQYVVDLEYTATPDYKYCRTLFSQALISIGCKDTDSIDFSTSPTTPKAATVSRKRPHAADSSSCAKLKSKPTVEYLSADDEASPPKVARKQTAVDVVKTPAKKSTPVRAGKKTTAESSVKKATPTPVSTAKKSTRTVSAAANRKRKRNVNGVSTSTQTTPRLAAN